VVRHYLNLQHIPINDMKRVMKGFPGLYREEYGNVGKRYRILINHKKEIIQEYFYFRNAATKAEAKANAIARWHELREIYPVITKRRFREIPRNPSSSGITGVTRIVTVVKGHEYEFWKASWTTIRGERRARQFSINKYGEKKAKILAIKTRKEALDALGID